MFQNCVFFFSFFFFFHLRYKITLIKILLYLIIRFPYCKIKSAWLSVHRLTWKRTWYTFSKFCLYGHHYSVHHHHHHYHHHDHHWHSNCLNENVPQRLIFKTSFPICWNFLEMWPCGMKYITRGRIWEFKYSILLSIFSLCFMSLFEDVNTQLPSPAIYQPLVVISLCHNGLSSLWNPSFYKYSWYGCLNKNGHNRPICLNTWSSVAGTVWKGLRSITLLEEVIGGVLRMGWRFQKPLIPSKLSLLYACGQICKLSATALVLCLPACGHAPCHDNHGLTP